MMKMATLELPVLDFSKYSTGTPEEREEFSHALVASFEQYSSARIINYGMQEEQLKQVFEQVLCASRVWVKVSY